MSWGTLQCVRKHKIGATERLFKDVLYFLAEACMVSWSQSALLFSRQRKGSWAGGSIGHFRERIMSVNRGRGRAREHLDFVGTRFVGHASGFVFYSLGKWRPPTCFNWGNQVGRDWIFILEKQLTTVEWKQERQGAVARIWARGSPEIVFAGEAEKWEWIQSRLRIFHRYSEGELMLHWMRGWKGL